MQYAIGLLIALCLFAFGGCAFGFANVMQERTTQTVIINRVGTIDEKLDEIHNDVEMVKYGQQLLAARREDYVIFPKLP